MKVTNFTKPKGVTTIITAVIFILNPNLFFELIFSAQLDSAGIMVARILGGSYLGAGVAIWSIKSSKDITPVSACMYAVAEAVAAIAIFVAMISNTMNFLGWLLGGAYIYYTVEFIRLAKVSQKASA